MSDPAISPDSVSVTSSLALAPGALLCAEQAFQIAIQSGPGAALVSLSPRQAQEQGLTTSGTYGPPSTGSSRSASLMSSLASKLQARTDLLGSTLYRLTFKVRITPSGLRIPAVRAWAHRTSVNDFTTWATPTARDFRHANRLPWAERGGGKKGEQLNNQVVHFLSGWPTPTAQSPNSLRGKGQDPMKRKEQGHTVNLTDAIHYIDLENPARLTASGEMLTGSAAGMVSGGQLTPEHSLWLMALPSEWACCGRVAMLSMPNKRASSSKPLSKP